jgi:hypothetical protein
MQISPVECVDLSNVEVGVRAKPAQVYAASSTRQRENPRVDAPGDCHRHVTNLLIPEELSGLKTPMGRRLPSVTFDFWG